MTTNYDNRLVDVELLQSIVVPGAIQRVHVTSVGQDPKIVAGIEKAVQRYAVLLLTSVFAPFLQLHLPRRVGVGKHLQNDAGRNVRAEAQRQDGEALEGTTPDGVHEAEERVVVHQLFEHLRADARNGHHHVDAERVNRENDEDENDSSSEILIGPSEPKGFRE